MKNTKRYGSKYQLIAHIYYPAIGYFGFSSYHSTDKYFMLVKWLTTNSAEDNNLPGYGHSLHGFGGFVLNKSRDKILMIQENSGTSARYGLWKLPGGLSEQNELLKDDVREIFEEACVKTVFKQ